jgi:hypothetical protein
LVVAVVRSFVGVRRAVVPAATARVNDVVVEMVEEEVDLLEVLAGSIFRERAPREQVITFRLVRLECW